MSVASDTSSITSFGDISVCEEISELIERCQELHEYIHTSYETLTNIHSLVMSHNNINVTSNGITTDLDTILEQIHKEVIEDIEKTGNNTFAERLLSMLESATF